MLALCSPDAEDVTPWDNQVAPYTPGARARRAQTRANYAPTAPHSIAASYRLKVLLKVLLKVGHRLVPGYNQARPQLSTSHVTRSARSRRHEDRHAPRSVSRKPPQPPAAGSLGAA